MRKWYDLSTYDSAELTLVGLVLVFVVLFVLKVTLYTNLSWWIIMAPIYVPIVILGIMIYTYVRNN